MKKEELIKLLNEIEGNLEVVVDCKICTKDLIELYIRDSIEYREDIRELELPYIDLIEEKIHIFGREEDC